MEELKTRLLAVYKSRGFEVLSNHLKHLQIVKKEEKDTNALAIEDLNSILSKL